MSRPYPLKLSQETENITQLHSHSCHAATDPHSHTSHRSIHATEATHDSAFPASVLTLEDAARLAISKDLGENCCWTYARAVKAFEKHTKRPLSSYEAVRSAFSVWWAAAKNRLPPGADFEEYQDDFIQCYQKALTPLGENSVENALLIPPRKEDELFFGPKKSKLIALCRELQRLSGRSPFFLSVRHAARAMGTKDLYTARNALSALIHSSVLQIEERGQLAGRKATRYRFHRLKTKTVK